MEQSKNEIFNNSWWKAHKKDIAYIYNCFSGNNGAEAYYIVAGLSILLFIVICFLVDIVNSLSVLMIYLSIFLIILHLDLVIESNKLPWKANVKHIHYTRFKKAILEPIRAFREWIYQKIGLLSKNTPKVTIFYLMLLCGIFIVVTLSLIPVKLFSGAILVGVLVVPQFIRTYIENDVTTAEEFRKYCKEELKKRGLYVSEKVIRESIEKNEDIDPKLIEKKKKAKRAKGELKRKSKHGRISQSQTEAVFESVLKTHKKSDDGGVEPKFFLFQNKSSENHTFDHNKQLPPPPVKNKSGKVKFD